MAYQPRFSSNPAQFVNRDPGLQQFDFGRGFRALAEQNLREKQLKQNQDQFMKSQAQNQSQFDSTQSFQKQRHQDDNTRFSLELVDKQEDRQIQRDDKKAEAMKATLQKARNAVVSGRYEEADALLGPLAEMGVEVNKSPGKDGKPVYKFKAPTFGDRPGPVSFDDIQSKFSGQNQSQVPQQGTSQNPVDPMLQEQFPEEQSSGDVVLEKQLDGILGKQGEGLLQATGGNQPEQPQAPEQTQEPGFDPYSLDTAALQTQIDSRLQPYLRGLVNAMPGAMQGRIANLSAGARALGGTPEQTIETMQKPMDSAIRAQGDVLSADAARMRAFNSNENQDSNRNIRLEDRQWRRLDGIEKKWDLPNRKQKLQKVYETIGQLGEHNPSADGLIISTIRGMYEKGTMTDKDFENTKMGIKPVWQSWPDFFEEKVKGGGLNPDSRAGLTRFMKKTAEDDESAIMKAQDQLMTQYKTAGSQEEAETVLKYMYGAIPEQLWRDDVKEAFGMPVEKKTGSVDSDGNYSTKPGAKSTKSASSSSSSSSSVTTNPNDEAEELLK
jgi:hypothetical protein